MLFFLPNWDENVPHEPVFHDVVSGWLKTIQLVREDLRQPENRKGSAGTCLVYCTGFNDIANELYTYLQEERHQFNDVLRHSKGAGDWAIEAMNQAVIVADLFEAFASSSEPYRWGVIERELHKLTTALKNLDGYLGT